MKKKILLATACLATSTVSAQIFSGDYTSEWQWNGHDKTNWVNLLRLNANVPLWKNGTFEAATIHIAKTGETIIDDWQTFSNIEEENNVAAIAVLGLRQEFEYATLFLGVRNVNEDFFTSECTSLFTSSSCGILPTISASYPIANYPLSGLTVYFDMTFDGWTFKNGLYNGVGYNGWTRHDNPFLVRFGRDGVFNISELSYEYEHGRYFAGAAVHSRLCPIDAEGGMCGMDEALKKTSCAWYVYGEQTLWKSNGDNRLFLMAQYSENTDHRNGCRRYAELGSVYTDGNSNQVGLSGQYAQFFYGKEWSVEATWHKRINRALSIQPSVQYICNGNGDFAVLSARIYCHF